MASRFVGSPMSCLRLVSLEMDCWGCMDCTLDPRAQAQSMDPLRCTTRMARASRTLHVRLLGSSPHAVFGSHARNMKRRPSEWRALAVMRACVCPLKGCSKGIGTRGQGSAWYPPGLVVRLTCFLPERPLATARSRFARAAAWDAGSWGFYPARGDCSASRPITLFAEQWLMSQLKEIAAREKWKDSGGTWHSEMKGIFFKDDS